MRGSSSVDLGLILGVCVVRGRGGWVCEPVAPRLLLRPQRPYPILAFARLTADSTGNPDHETPFQTLCSCGRIKQALDLVFVVAPNPTPC
jgi:hypothetical protein